MVLCAILYKLLSIILLSIIFPCANRTKWNNSWQYLYLLIRRRPIWIRNGLRWKHWISLKFQTRFAKKFRYLLTLWWWLFFPPPVWIVYGTSMTWEKTHPSFNLNIIPYSPEGSVRYHTSDYLHVLFRYEYRQLEYAFSGFGLGCETWVIIISSR